MRSGALAIRPKFPVGISEISMYQMKRYFPPGSFHSHSGQIQTGGLEDVLVSFRVFDDFEFTDDILEDDDDVVMFKKAIFF